MLKDIFDKQPTIYMLGRCGVKFLAFVFDGARLPVKEETKQIRESKAEDALAYAIRRHTTMHAAIDAFNKKDTTRTPDGYLKGATRAFFTFRYQFVYTLDSHLNVVSVGHLNDPGDIELGDTEEYLGVCLGLEEARAIGKGTRRPNFPYEECVRGPRTTW